MCMTKDNFATQQFLNKHRGKKYVVVWKIYELRSGKLHPPYMITALPIRPGSIKSNRVTKVFDPYDRCETFGRVDIRRGIHVYLTRRRARKMRTSYDGKVFKCTARLDDLVGVSSYGHAVFMKIYISRKEFKRGKKGRN